MSAEQQFLIAHGTRSYYGSTQLLDVAGEPFWIVNEGEYCMMNTLDLSIDQAFWELKHNPWVIQNLLDNFIRHYSYVDEIKLDPRNAKSHAAGGISFCHDMGAHNNFSPRGTSSYELAHLKGCFSFMTQEQLCNWILLAACYVAKTGDTHWLRQNRHVIDACAASMRARANPQTGLMAHDSARCDEGWEITTYDSLDESLGQARANTYLAVKCWASWVGLEMLAELGAEPGLDGAHVAGDFAEKLAQHLIGSVGEDGILPAVLEPENPGYQSRILPTIEALIYPFYWMDFLSPKHRAKLQKWMRHPLVSMLSRHVRELLNDPQRRNLFADGGIKLSSTSDNSWMSKIAIVQYVAREILKMHESDPRIAELFANADAAHVGWQVEGSAYWACSDQFVKGIAKASRYYPRLITAALWMEESRKPRVEVMVKRQDTAVLRAGIK